MYTYIHMIMYTLKCKHIHIYYNYFNTATPISTRFRIEQTAANYLCMFTICLKGLYDSIPVLIQNFMVFIAEASLCIPVFWDVELNSQTDVSLMFCLVTPNIFLSQTKAEAFNADPSFIYKPCPDPGTCAFAKFSQALPYPVLCPLM